MILVVLIASVLRLLPHEPNVAPIAAMALFGGAYLSKKKAFVIPVLAMVVSDYFIGFHSVWMWVYGSFLLTVVLGFFIRKNLSFKNIILASTISSVSFFLITNFGVWFAGTMYPKNLTGLLECYYMGLPFFRNTLVGDYGYNLIFFGSYFLIRNYEKNLVGNVSS